ncbi:MAG TPA: hypothetical protein VF432_26325 [Thermoanaerobaculia bacterium]
MGVGCVLLLWAIPVAIALAVAATGAAIFLRSAARRSMPGMIAGGGIGAVGAVVAIVAIVFIAGWLVWGMWPHETTSRAAFQDAFGFPAGAEVTQIRSRTAGSTDSHEQFLRFHAPPPTVAAIVSTRFQRSTANDCRQESLQWKDDAPAWWTPSVTPQTECYTAEPYDQRLASNAAWLLYDRSTGAAHFHYHGVD